MSNNASARIEELGLERLKLRTKCHDLLSVGVQIDEVAGSGAKLYRVGAIEAGDPNGPLHQIVIDERGEEVDLKALPERDRRGLFGGERRPWIQYSYAVKFVCGVQEATDGCCCAPVRTGAYATEINIHNYHGYWAYLSKSVIPVVLGGLPVGREPRSVAVKGRDWLSLAPGHATMDDCCRINHLLFDAEPLQKASSLNIGFLEILSNQELQITAVYTATDLESRSISIEVEQFAPKVRYPYYYWPYDLPFPVGVSVPAQGPTAKR